MYNLTVKSNNSFLFQFARLLALCFVFSALLIACGGAEEESPAPADIDSPSSQSPVPPTAAPATATSDQSSAPSNWPTAGWPSSTPEEQGMDSQKLAELIDHIQQQELDIHSVTVVRNGYIVADAAYYPFEKGALHNVRSVTKSITFALIGIAVEHGHRAGVP